MGTVLLVSLLRGETCSSYKAWFMAVKSYAQMAVNGSLLSWYKPRPCSKFTDATSYLF